MYNKEVDESTKKIKKLAYVVAALAGAVILVFLVKDIARPDETKQSPDVKERGHVYLHVDKGLVMEHENRETSVFERYHFYDDSIVGPDKSVNISETNAQLILTHPDGTEEDVTSGNWFYSLSIIPPSPEGEYKLTANINDGETYEETFYFSEPQKVEFTAAEDTKRTGDGDELGAFSLGDIDLTNLDSVFHIPPNGAIIDIAPHADEHMWISMRLVDAERPGEHIFLAKKDGIWYYASVNTPDFEF